MKEPIIHSHIEDGLPDDHPFADDEVFCKTCNEMLHAANNECMRTWVETGDGYYCIDCFTKVADIYLENKFALDIPENIIPFHAGCHECTQQLEQKEGVFFCRNCRYFSSNWYLENLNNKIK